MTAEACSTLRKGYFDGRRARPLLGGGGGMATVLAMKQSAAEQTMNDEYSIPG